jgi:hypothetical protein
MHEVPEEVVKFNAEDPDFEMTCPLCENKIDLEKGVWHCGNEDPHCQRSEGASFCTDCHPYLEPELDEDGNVIKRSALGMIPEGEEMEGDEDRESPDKEQAEGDSDLERVGDNEGEDPPLDE